MAMLNPMPKGDDTWKDRLTVDEVREIITLEAVMEGCLTAYRAASKRREFLRNRAKPRRNGDLGGGLTVS